MDDKCLHDIPPMDNRHSNGHRRSVHPHRLLTSRKSLLDRRKAGCNHSIPHHCTPNRRNRCRIRRRNRHSQRICLRNRTRPENKLGFGGASRQMLTFNPQKDKNILQYEKYNHNINQNQICMVCHLPATQINGTGDVN